MGGPAFPIVPNLCIDVVEESVITSVIVPPEGWKRYVNDSFIISSRT